MTYAYPVDFKHTQPVVDQFRYVPPLDQTPYAAAELKWKSNKKKAADDSASIASTSTFASTKALLKTKFSKKSSTLRS